MKSLLQEPPLREGHALFTDDDMIEDADIHQTERVL